MGEGGGETREVREVDRLRDNLREMEKEREIETAQLKRRHNEEMKEYIEEEEKDNEKWKQCIIKKLTIEFEER